METTSNELGTLVVERKRVAPRFFDTTAASRMTSAMAASDILGLALAVAVAVGLRLALIGPYAPDLYVWFLPAAVLMLVLFSMRHLYPGIGLGAVEEFKSLTTTISLLFVMVSVSLLAIHGEREVSRFEFALFWLASMVTIPAARRLVRHAMVKLGLWGEPLAIIGRPEQAERVYDRFIKDPKTGLKPVAIFSPRGEVRERGTLECVYAMEQMEQVCQQKRLRMAAVLYDELDEMEAIVARYRETFERLILISTNGNHHYLNKVCIRNYGGMVSLEVHHRLLDGWSQAIKRLMDITIAGTALALLFPFFVVLAGLIYVDSPGRILYRQKRLGKRGKTFTLFKLRTMHLNADEVLEAHLEANREARAEWDRHQKLRHDPRITRMGRILRRFSIDELTQLWNVFRGEMSLVGPRPIMLKQRELYGDNYQHYVRVAPGISGLWQINGRNQTSFSRRTEMDMEYVISWSVWMDIYILVRTVWVVLRRDGAY